MEKDFTRDDCLLLAKMAQQTERYGEMLQYITKFVQSDQELSQQERTIVSSAYKNVVGNKRAELRVLQAIEQKEQSKQNEIQVNFVKNYQDKIEKELRTLCTDILAVLDHLIAKCRSIDGKVFYYKMKGDYNRYLAEFLIDDEYTQVVEAGQTAYQEADSLAKANLAATDPIRLGLQLNKSVFYYEILQKHTDAIQIANQAFDDAISNIDNVNEENYKDCTLIMQLLRDNLTLWSTENINEEQNDIDNNN